MANSVYDPDKQSDDDSFEPKTLHKNPVKPSENDADDRDDLKSKESAADASTGSGGSFNFNPKGDRGKTGTGGLASAEKVAGLASGFSGGATAATTVAAGAKNFFWGSKNRKRATVGGSITGTVVSFGIFAFIVISGPGQIVQLDQMLSRNFNTTNNASGNRSLHLIRSLRANNVGETRLSVLGQKRLRGNLADLEKIGITFNPNSSGYFGANEAGSIDTNTLKEKYPELENLSPEERAAWLESRLGVPASSFEYKGSGVFDVNASDWALPTVESFIQNVNGLLGNGRVVNAVANRDLAKYFDIPNMWHIATRRAAGGVRNVTNANDAKQAEEEAQQKELQPTEDAPQAVKAVDETKSNANSYDSLTSRALLYTGGACFVRSVSGDIITINRYRVVLPAAITALRFISLGEQIKAGQDISQQDVEGAEKSLYNSKGSVWQGMALEVTSGTRNPSGPDIPAQYQQAFSSNTTVNTIENAANDSVGGKTEANILCSQFGQIAQGVVSLFQVIGGAALAVVGDPEATAADYASIAGRVGGFATEAFVQMQAIGFIQNFILGKTATGTLAKDAFSGPTGGNLLAYGAREAANMGSIAQGGVSLGDNLSKGIAEKQQQQDERQFRSENFFARTFDINDSRTLAGHLADSVRPGYTQNVASVIGGFGNMGNNLLSNLASIFLPRSQAAANQYDWKFPIYSIPPQLLNDPSLSDPYANADDIAKTLDANCLNSDGSINTNDPCSIISKAQTCFGVGFSKDSGVWDVTPQGNAQTKDIDPNSTDYQNAGCADLSDPNWKRMIMFVFDTHTMKSMECYLGDDQSCTDIGYGQSAGGSAPAPTSTTGYQNPLRDVMKNGSLFPRRIDEGVDYGGHGPVYAIGNGTVTFAGTGIWFGAYGQSVVYKLSDGPAAGMSVYFSESCTPTVQKGDPVTSNTVICQMHGDNDPWVETGWAVGDGTDTPSAHIGYQECATAYGVNFSDLLKKLGAPPGNIECGVDETLPQGWPTWK